MVAFTTTKSFDAVQINFGVITSYSIHYTKLYDHYVAQNLLADAELAESWPATGSYNFV